MGHTTLWKSLWELEGCIKVEHVDAHQKNSFPGLEGEWNQQADIPLLSLKTATWVHEVSEYGVSAAMQRWAESRHILLVHSEAENANKNFCRPAKKTRDCRWLCGRFPVGKALNIASKFVGSPGGLQTVLHR